MNLSDALLILNLKNLTNGKELNKQYRKLALRLHPDKMKGDSLPFQKLSEAYQCAKSSLEEQTLPEFIFNVITNLFPKKFTLYPTLDELMSESNIFKLQINNETIYVPLWHHEIEFDNSIIVECKPQTCHFIDCDNNIFVLAKESNDIMIGNKKFVLDKKKKTFYFKNQGIPKMCESNMYDNTCKADVIVVVC